MPSKADIIDGIPVTLKEGIMYSFHGTGSYGSLNKETPIKLGTYADKKATWIKSDAQDTWLNSFRDTLVPRSRK